MTMIILGILIGAGAALTWLSIVETEERKKTSEWEKRRGGKE